MNAPREVLFEFMPAGPVVKVTAVDPVTGIEATIQGPANAGEEVLKRSALQKLDYLLSKRPIEK